MIRIKYPACRKQLMLLLAEDQRDVRLLSQAVRHWPSVVSRMEPVVLRRARTRSERAVGILNTIGAPTQYEVGVDGSQALATIGLHSGLANMELVRSSFKAAYDRAPNSVASESVAALTDAVLLRRHRRQRYGTQWLLGENGRYFLPSVEDFNSLGERRARLGLALLVRPIDLGDGISARPRRRVPATVADHHELSVKDFQSRFPCSHE